MKATVAEATVMAGRLARVGTTVEALIARERKALDLTEGLLAALDEIEPIEWPWPVFTVWMRRPYDWRLDGE
jgi:hypothetical protein